MIIDAHLHTWDTEQVGIAWLTPAGLTACAPLPDEAPDRRYVLIEADADDGRREAEWLVALARGDARVHGVVPSIAVERPTVAEDLHRLAGMPEVVGIRRLLQDRRPFEPPGLLDGLRRLAAHDLPFDACVRADELPALVKILERVPELVIVLDHMGKPPVGDDAGMRRWAADLKQVAALPNVHCKLSGLPAECGRDDTLLEAVTEDVVGHAVEVFGAHRCLLGSDRPVSRTSSDWCDRVLNLILERDRPGIAYENAAALYRRER